MKKKRNPAMFLVQDSRGNVGNNLMFWGPNHSGYTSNLQNAGRYTRKEAFALNRNRSSDIPWPEKYVLERLCEEADMQYLRQDDLLGASLEDGYYVQPLPARYEGNSMLFLTAKGTTSARRANVKLYAHCANPVIGQAWPRALVDAVWRPVANAAGMDLRAALGESYNLLAKEKAPRRERYRCQGCGVFMSEAKFWAGACSRCGTDNRP